MSEEKSNPTNRPAPRLEDAPWDVQVAFRRRQEEVLPRVRSIVRRHPQLDHDLVMSEVWECAWRTFPTMHREEQAALAAGQVSPHKWPAYFCLIASRRAADHLRRVGPYVRRRPSRARHIAAAVSPTDIAVGSTAPDAGAAQPSADTAPTDAEATRGAALRQSWEVPLHPDIVDSVHADPLQLLIQKESLERIRATLYESLEQLEQASPREHLAVRLFLDEVPDREACKQLGTSPSGLYHLRRAGVLSLRRLFAARGYAVCPTNANTRL